MAGQRFKVEHLLAALAQCAEQPALGRSSAAANDAQRERGRQDLELGQHSAAELAVATFEHLDVKADLLEHHRQCARALATAPAIDERPPAACLDHDLRFDVPCDVARHHRGAALARIESRCLLVFSADDAPFVVVQHRPVEGIGQVVLGVFVRAARVDHGIELGPPRKRINGRDSHEAHRAIPALGQATGAAAASSNSLSMRNCAFGRCSSGPSTRKVSSTRSPRVVTLASCRFT